MRDKTLFLRADEHPFPWWGPFDVTNTIGRIMILVGLWGLSYIFVAGIAMMQGQLDANYNMLLFALLLIIITAVMTAGGAGILIRKKWGIGGLRIVLVLLTMLLVILTASELTNGSKFFRISTYSYDLLEITPISILYVLIYAFIFPATVLPLWLYFRSPHILHEFESTADAMAHARLYNTTKRFGLAVALWGIILMPFSITLFSQIAFTPLSEVFVINLYLIILFVSGFAALCAGMGFWASLNKARRILLFVIVLIMALTAVAFAFISVETVRELISRRFRLRSLMLIARIPFAFFGLIILEFIFFEILRYLKSAKAKAWCGVGKYEQPWKTKVDWIKDLSKEREEDKS
ncbi:MAG: hypothetical protein ACYS8W_14045 [Planctomycetota bacterium]|jgi:hypothetical protein